MAERGLGVTDRGLGVTDRGLEVIMLDVGQGDATIVRLPDGAPPIVFDCRDAHVVRRMLDQRGDTDVIGAIIFSHLDKDHCGGGLDLLKTFPGTIRAVYIDADRPLSDSDDGGLMAKELIDYALAGHLDGRWSLQPVVTGLRPLFAGPDWSVRLLAPEHATRLMATRTGDHGSPNLYSAVLQVQMGERRVLIGGDAPLATWAKIPSDDAKADVFRIPHHGGAIDDGGIPTGWDVARLYEVVGAPTAVVSVGTHVRESWGHPVPEWVAPIARGRCRMMCTQVTMRCQPDVRVRSDAHRAAIDDGDLAEPPWRQYTHAMDPRARGAGRNREVPCAGTVVARVTADGALTVLPLPDQHATTVALWDQPLCRPLEIEEPRELRVRGGVIPT